jgi:hypothetical protein
LREKNATCFAKFVDNFHKIIYNIGPCGGFLKRRVFQLHIRNHKS